MKDINIALSTEAREATVTSLTQYLADSYVLYAKTHNFHWNVEGRHFRDLHKLFQDQYEDLAESVDETAERIRMMGEYAPGTLKHFIEVAQITEATEVPSDVDMVTTLHGDHELLARALREYISKLQEGGDEGTADYFIKRLQVHEKTAWMLRSMLV